MTDESAAWLEWRRRGIGASDVAAAVHGIYGGAYGVVHSKLTGEARDTIDPVLADRGHRWEPAIADAVHALTGQYVVGEQAWVEHKEHPWRRCTVDGFLAPTPQASPDPDELDAVMEIKTKGLYAPYRWDVWGTQVQWQMHVTGLRQAVIVVASIDDFIDRAVGLRIETVDADRTVQQQLVAHAEQLWRHVQAGTYPEPGAEALDIVKDRWRDAAPDEQPVELDGSWLDDSDGRTGGISEYVDVMAHLKALTERKREIEAALREAVGGRTLARAGDYEIRIGEPVRKLDDDGRAWFLAVHPECGTWTLDTDKAKAIDPELYDALKKPTSDRRLTIKENR